MTSPVSPRSICTNRRRWLLTSTVVISKPTMERSHKVKCMTGGGGLDGDFKILLIYIVVLFGSERQAKRNLCFNKSDEMFAVNVYRKCCTAFLLHGFLTSSKHRHDLEPHWKWWSAFRLGRICYRTWITVTPHGDFAFFVMNVPRRMRNVLNNELNHEWGGFSCWSKPSAGTLRMKIYSLHLRNDKKAWKIR